MNAMQINDRIIGLLTILGGIGVIIGTLHFRSIPGQQFGAAFFPRIVGGILILCGLIMILKAAGGALVSVGDMLKGRSGLKVIAVLLSVIAWVYLSPILGFIATTALLIAVLAFTAGGKPVASIATGIGMSLVLFLIFGELLRVPLPFVAIERLLS